MTQFAAKTSAELREKTGVPIRMESFNETLSELRAKRERVLSGDSLDTAGAVNLTTAQSGHLILVDKADGLAFVTPDSGDGDIVGTSYKFYVDTTISSNNFSISGATADNLFVGGVNMVDTDSSNALSFFAPDGSDDDVFSCNGTTTGGIEGTLVTVTCIAADKWLIEGTVLASGTVATPFS